MSANNISSEKTPLTDKKKKIKKWGEMVGDEDYVQSQQYGPVIGEVGEIGTGEKYANSFNKSDGDTGEGGDANTGYGDTGEGGGRKKTKKKKRKKRKKRKTKKRKKKRKKRRKYRTKKR